MTEQNLILSLFEIGAVRFGTFKLKSGIESPVYLDLRRTVSFPKLLVAIAEALHEPMRGLTFDLICGVPYTALPFATAISIQHNLPMLLRRKERKEYGTGQLLEGVFEKGQRCLLIEDVITSGSSLLETAASIRQEGLVVEEAIVLVDRCQGGIAALQKEGLRVHPILNLPQIADLLEKEKKIEPSRAAAVKAFLRENQVC